MIRLADKTNVATGVSGYPYGKIINDSGIGDGTPVDEQVYNDVHQFFERMFDQSGLTANGQPDNSTNGFQLYEALQALVAAGMPNVVAGAWIDGVAPTLTCDTGTASIFSTLNNRYKIIGKTFFWEFRGAITISSGTPGRVSFTYPVLLNQKNFNGGLPTKGRAYYKDSGELIYELQSATIDFKPISPTAFSGSAQSISFHVIMELI